MPTANEVSIALRAKDEMTASLKSGQEGLRALQPAAEQAARGLQAAAQAARQVNSALAAAPRHSKEWQQQMNQIGQQRRQVDQIVLANRQMRTSLQATAPVATELAGGMRQAAGAVGAAQQQARAMQPAAEQAARGLRGLGGGARQAERGVQALTVSLNTLAKATVALAAFTGFMRVLDAAKGSIIGFNSTLEQQGIAFETMLGSAEKGQQFLGQLQQFARRTGIEVSGLAQRMLAFGFSAEVIPELLQDIVSAGAGLRSGQVGIDRMTTAIGQMQAKTRVMSEEMLQLTEAGVPAWQILADAIGKSVPETQKLIEKGQIASSVFIKAFQEFARLKFGDLIAKQASTFEGAMNIIGTNIRFIGSVAFKPVFDRLRDLAVRLAEFVRSDQFGEWATRVSVHVEVVLRALGILAGGFQRALSAIARIVLSIGTIILRGLQLLNPFARHSPSLVEQVEAGLAEIKGQFARLPGDIQPKLQAIGARMAWLREQMSGGSGGEAHVKALGTALETQERAIRAAELALRPYERALEAVQRRASTLGDALRAAEGDLRRFQQAPLEGERRFDDALFANSQAAARLRLELAELEARGQQGQGFVDRVRFGQQRAGLEQRLRQLGNEEERLRLQRQVTIDPQRRALEQIGRAPEVSFVEAMKGAQDAFNRVQQLGPAFAAAQAETERMAADLQAQRDALQEQKDALDLIRSQYEEIADAAKAAKAAKDDGFAFGPVDLAGLKATGDGLDDMLKRMEALREEMLKGMQPALDGFEGKVNDLLKPLEDLADWLGKVADAGDTAKAALISFATEVGRLWDTVLRPPVERAIENFKTNLPAAIRTTEAQFASLKKAVTEAVVWWQDFEKVWGGGDGGNVFDQLSRSINKFGKSLHEPLMMVINFLDILLERAVEVGSIVADMVAGRGVRRPNFLDEQGRPRDPFAEAVERTRLRIGPSQQALEEIGGRAPTRMPQSPEYRPAGGNPAGGSRAGGQAEARAHGGPVLPGRSYLVGERGPELFRPRLAGAIIPNRQLSAGGGGLTINGPLIGAVTVTGAADEERLAATIERVLAERWQAAAAQGVRAPLGVTRVN